MCASGIGPIHFLSNGEFISLSFLMPSDSEIKASLLCLPLCSWWTLPGHLGFESLPEMGGCSQKAPWPELKSSHQGFHIYLFLPWRAGVQCQQYNTLQIRVFFIAKQLSISKVIFNGKCVSTLWSEGWRMFCFLLCYFSFPLKNEDGMKNRRTGAGGEEGNKQKCFQREIFCFAFFIILC